jgi:hypothetical protein
MKACCDERLGRSWRDKEQPDEIMGHRNMMHNTRILKNQNQISEFEKKVPEWMRRLRPVPTHRTCIATTVS